MERPTHTGHRGEGSLAKAVPGRLFEAVKVLSYVELAVFMALLVVWIVPGYPEETFFFGLAHGIGYIALVLLIFAAMLRREAPWPLLAATLTPAGPIGSVIGIWLIEHRGWGLAGAPGDDSAAHAGNSPPPG